MSRTLGRAVLWLARALAVLLAGGGLYLLGADALRSLSQGAITLKPLGEVWYEIDTGSLNMFQAGIQRRISPELWDFVIAPMLNWPAWVLPLALAAVLAFFTRPRRQARS